MESHANREYNGAALRHSKDSGSATDRFKVKSGQCPTIDPKVGAIQCGHAANITWGLLFTTPKLMYLNESAADAANLPAILAAPTSSCLLQAVT